MNRLFYIGEMARLFGINAKTLRYYDELGLVKPEYTNPDTGYRYYSSLQFERLNTIKYLRAMDMPLAKINQFFENKDIDSMILILKEQQEEVQRKKRELEQIERKLDNRLDMLLDAAETVYDEVKEVHFPERRVAMLRTEIPVTDDLEYPIRQLELSTRLGASMFLGKVGVSISEGHLREHCFEKFSAIFVILEQGDEYDGEAVVVPEGEYLTLRYCGTHTQAEVQYERLFTYMKKKGYLFKGNSIEITLVDSGMTNDMAGFVTELQIPYVSDVKNRRGFPKYPMIL